MRNAILLTLVGIVAVSLLTVGVVYALPQESPAEFSSGASAEALPSEDTSRLSLPAAQLRRQAGGVYRRPRGAGPRVRRLRAHPARIRSAAAGTRGARQRLRQADRAHRGLYQLKNRCGASPFFRRSFIRVAERRGFLCESARPSLRRRLRAGGRRIFVGTEGSRSRPRIWRKKEAVERERALLRFCHFSREAVTEL